MGEIHWSSRTWHDFLIKQEYRQAHSPQFHGVAERGLCIIDAAEMATMIQAERIFSLAQLPDAGQLWTEAMHCLHRECRQQVSARDVLLITVTGHTFWPSSSRHTADRSNRTVKVAAKGGKLLLPGTADPPPTRFHGYVDPGGARGEDEFFHVGRYAIKVLFTTAASLDGTYGGGREMKRRRQFADTPTAVRKRGSSHTAYVKRSNWRR